MSQRLIIRTTGQTGPGLGQITDHLADTTDAHDASAISVLDSANNYTATDVEGVLAELPSQMVVLPDGSRQDGQAPVWDEDAQAWVSTSIATQLPTLTAIYFDGTTNNFASTPDTAALDITGDITVMVWAAPASLTPAATQILAAKFASTGDQRSWHVQYRTDGTLGWQHSTTGATAGNITTAVSTANPSWTVDVGRWIAVTLDADTGSSTNQTKFWQAAGTPDVLPSSWAQIGSTITRSGTTSIHSGTAPVEVGAYNATGTNPFIGRIARVVICNDIGANATPGTNIVADFRADLGVATRYRDSTGKVWTLTGSAWAGTEADPFA